jgi:hypothetical protein
VKGFKQKSDHVALFELAAGESLRDYLHDRISVKGMTALEVADDMTEIIKIVLTSPIIQRGLFLVHGTNVSSWCYLLGIKLKGKRGRKPKEKT